MSTSGIDLLISFDTTGSMFPVISQVKENVEKFVKSMFNDFNDIRIGIITHGDYCDAGNPYTIRGIDFSTDEDELCQFVRDTLRTDGGDFDECYELVLNMARTKFNWIGGRKKVFMLIGDAAPHGVNYFRNTDKIDWKNEAKLLGDMGVQIFAVHALSYYRKSSKGFYEYIANKTSGVYLTLDNFSEAAELIKTTCISQDSEERLNEYVSIIRSTSKLTTSMYRNIRRLKGEHFEETDVYQDYGSSRLRERSIKSGRSAGERVFTDSSLIPVTPGRFQVIEVPKNTDIRSFVISNGIEFKRGRGFYELTKSETVQQYKEIILQDRETGEMFTGAQVRERLGLQPQVTSGGAHERLSSKDTKKFRVFVQSTSVNRKLIGGTTFLYEIHDIADSGTYIGEENETIDSGIDSGKVAKEATKRTKSVRSDKSDNTEKRNNTKRPSNKASNSKKISPKTLKRYASELKKLCDLISTDEISKESLNKIDKQIDKISKYIKDRS